MAAGTALFSLADPIARSIILPLAASGLSVGLVRLLFGDGRGSNLASFGIGVGIIASWLVLFGFPTWPAFGMGEKAICIIALGLVIGAAADRLPALDPVILLLLTSWPVVLVLWMLEPTVAGGLSGAPLVRFGLLLVGSITLFVRLREEQDNSQSATVHLLWFGIGLGLVGYIMNSYRLNEAGAAIAAAVVGYLVWNLPKTRYPFGFSAMLAGGSAVTALAAILMASDVTTPLLPLLFLLFAGDIGRRLFRQKRGTLSAALGGIPPVAAAVLLAWISR